YLNRAKLEIPIDHRRIPAGSCLGGFSTPAPCPERAACDGRRPKTFTVAEFQSAARPVEYARGGLRRDQ
ncbi:MAG TPA: hypothetical protein VND19_16140, partial [Acetobacteraceae bacterium]|nr:hypothetical protein [Acetobacteraceae bacterium]